MKRTQGEKECEAIGFLKLPNYLLTVCGLTFSTDGVTISRCLVAYSGTIYVINSIITIKDITCFDYNDNFKSSQTTDKIVETLFQIAIILFASIMLYSVTRKLPAFVRTLQKHGQLIRDKSLNNDIRKSLKRISVIGFVISTAAAFCTATFKFMRNPGLEWEACPNHRRIFSSERQHNYVMKGFAVASLFCGFQCVAGLAFCLSLCTVVILHFKYLHRQLIESVAFIKNTDSWQEFSCVASQIRRIRNLYEHTRDLTTKLDDGVNLFVGSQFLVLIPTICLFTLNAFVPEFRLDLVVYDLFALSFVLLTLMVAANLNSQVKILRIFISIFLFT